MAVRVETADGVRTIWFCRPERRNAMTLPMFRAYYDALADADRDPAVRAIVVTGTGDWFCTGADPEVLAALLEQPGRSRPTDLGHPPDLPARLGTPIVAAINGGAAGLGFVHALYADVRFLAAEARLSTAFSRLGLVAEYGSAWLLPRLVGPAHALDLLLSGRKVGAEEALRIGLVQHVLPRDEVLAAATGYARELAARCSPASLAVIRRQVWSGLDTTLEQAAGESTRLMVDSFGRPDFRVAIEAMTRGRPPEFPPAPPSFAADPGSADPGSADRGSAADPGGAASGGDGPDPAGGGGPLRGLRVLELAGIGPGPFCAMLLADLGADVVRVDRPGGAAGIGTDPAHDLLNRGKRSIAVDLKDERGVAVVRQLAARADVLIEGYRPGVAERLGVGPEDCLAANPRLVYGRMTGWGQDGPLARTAGHDITYLALTGVLHAIGPADGAPQVPLNLLGDFGGGSLYLAVGILAALREVAGTGRGQVVDASIVDGVAHLSTLVHGLLGAGMWQDRRGANLLDGGAPFYGVYPTADGGHMAVGPLEPAFFAEFVTRLRAGAGLPAADSSIVDGQYDPAAWPGLRDWIARAFASRTRDEWCTVFEGSDACVAPVLSMLEAPEHPHLAARGTFGTAYGVRQPNPAPRFSLTPPTLGGPPALPGQHTREVLADWGIEVDPAGAPAGAGQGPD